MLYDEPDEEDSYELEDYLFDQGFEIQTLSFDLDASDIAEMHKDFLSTCDAVVLFYKNSNQAWLSKKLKELQTEKTSRKFLSALYMTGQKDKRKGRFKTRVVDEVIKNFNNFLPDKLNVFLDKLKKKRN